MDDFTDPASSVLATVVTLVVTYYGKLKKNFDKIESLNKVVLGDIAADRPGLVGNMRCLKEEVSELHKTQAELVIAMTALAKSVAENQKGFERALKEALAPVWKVLEKKPDKELMEAQLSHIFSDIERLMRIQDEKT